MGHPFAIVLSGNERIWTLVPASASEMNQWLYALRQSLDVKSTLVASKDTPQHFDQEYFSTDGSANSSEDSAKQEAIVESHLPKARRKLARRSSRTFPATMVPDVNLITVQDDSNT